MLSSFSQYVTYKQIVLKCYKCVTYSCFEMIYSYCYVLSINISHNYWSLENIIWIFAYWINLRRGTTWESLNIDCIHFKVSKWSVFSPYTNMFNSFASGNTLLYSYNPQEIFFRYWNWVMSKWQYGYIFLCI